MKKLIDFLTINKEIIAIAIGIITLMGLIKACEDEPKVKVKTEVDIEWIKDSIKEVLLKEIKPVYIDTGSTKYLKGEKVTKWKDSIVYVEKLDSEKKSPNTIKANIYTYNLKSNNATAKINITSQSEPLDITGVIEYPKETITKTVTKIKSKSGLFIYGQVPVNQNNINIEAGAIYQFKNSLMVLGGVQYNQFTNSGDIKVGIGIKIF